MISLFDLNVMVGERWVGLVSGLSGTRRTYWDWVRICDDGETDKRPIMVRLGYRSILLPEIDWRPG